MPISRVLARRWMLVRILFVLVVGVILSFGVLFGGPLDYLFLHGDYLSKTIDVTNLIGSSNN